MQKLVGGVLLSLLSPLCGAHELTTAFPDNVRVIRSSEEISVEYCPDNTCEVFATSDTKASSALQDFTYAYLLGVSSYIYLEPFQSSTSSKSSTAVLTRYRAECPQESIRGASRCIVGLLAKRHMIRASFVRYDEGRRNVVPVSLRPFTHGT